MGFVRPRPRTQGATLSSSTLSRQTQSPGQAGSAGGAAWGSPSWVLQGHAIWEVGAFVSPQGLGLASEPTQ